MNVVRYHQWPRQVARQQQVNQLFEHFFDQGAAKAPTETQWVPRVDVREEADRFVILADLPGIVAEAIEIQMDKGVLSISGERTHQEIAEGGKYSRNERRHGAFHREFALPDSADADNIVASGSNGVLEISIPKKPGSTPRRIQVGESPVQQEGRPVQ